MLNILKQPKGFYRGVFALMTPMILQNLISQSVALADTFMVGLTGEASLAAVTLANTPFFVLMVFTFGVQSGVGILVSQYWGKENQGAINRVLGVGVYVAFVTSALFAAAMFLFPRQILWLVTEDEALVALAAGYARIAGIAMILTSVTQVYMAAQRSCENPKLGVLVLASSSLINIFGNWLLIFGNAALGIAPMGVVGAAVATLAARIVEFIVCALYAVFNKHLLLRLGLMLRPGVLIVKDFIKYSLPVVINEALWGVSLMLYPMILGHMDSSQSLLAAYTIAGNLEKVFTVAVFATGSAVAVLIGKEIGAGRKNTVYSIAKSLAATGALLGLCAGALLLVSTLTVMEPFVYPLFGLSTDAAAAATAMLLILAVVVPFRNCGFAIGIGVLRGGGDVKAVALIDVLSLYLLALPFAAITGLVLHMDIAVVYFSVAIEEFVKTGILILRMRSKKWINDVTREIT
ncbi:MAG: MATE family efflux transporter [Oscillospiraceae bacterium]|jgi:putative MATE family efflux protein|nr:MATE family efflux transporter [Oscillospiraceae bacterium]